MKTIYIGIGNTFRSDDGAGIYIVRALKQTNIAGDFAECHGEGTALMEQWSGYDRVVLFDAVMTQEQPGKLYYLQANSEAIPTDFFKYSSHAFSVAEAVELSRILGTLPSKLEIYGIEGQDFSHGENLSPRVHEACDRVIKSLVV